MAIRERRGDASARRSLQEARLNQIGLVQVFESSAILSDRGGDRCDSDRSSAELLDDRREDPAVELVEAVLVHLKAPERFPGRAQIDGRLPGDFGEIAQPPQQPVGDARSPPAAGGDLPGRIRPDRYPDDLRRPFDDERHRGRVQRSPQILGIPIAADAAREIASRSRGTPRIANRLLRRLRDFAEVAGKSSIDLATAREALRRLEVDEHGFDELDRRILSTIIEKFGGGPVGIASIAASIGEDRGTLEDLYEPYLIQAGFLQRTPRGRVASALAYRHLGIVPPRRDGSLF